jgi:hypothetical protein
MKKGGVFKLLFLDFCLTITTGNTLGSTKICYTWLVLSHRAPTTHELMDTVHSNQQNNSNPWMSWPFVLI